jgi:hypothetical protein
LHRSASGEKLPEASKSDFRNTPGSRLEFHNLSAKAWKPGTSTAKTRFALLPGHDERRAKPDFAELLLSQAFTTRRAAIR